jgi:AcrR family transcriptional regulator
VESATSDGQPATPLGDRRDELLAAAARLFHEKGYDGTSTQDIADVLGILKGSLYYYIESKEDLLFEIIERTHEAFIENLRVVQSSDERPLDKLRTLIEGHVRIATAHVVEALVYIQDFRWLREERKQAILAQRARYERFIRDLLVEAQRSGEAPASLSPKLAEIAITSMLTSIPRWYRPNGKLRPDEIGDAFVRYSLHIVAAG